jgi:hypothetical protein
MLFEFIFTFFLILFYKFIEKNTKSTDLVYIIRFLFPLLYRVSVTSKLFENNYLDIKGYNYILLPELILFIYDLFDRIKKKNIKFDVYIHHFITIFLILTNIIGHYINCTQYGLHIGVNILNMHNIGDIFIRLPKLFISKSKNISILLGVFGIINWIYTRQIITYRYYFVTLWNLPDDNPFISKSKTVLILLYLIGTFYTSQVLNYFLKFILGGVYGGASSNQISFLHILKYCKNILFNNKNTIEYSIRKEENYTTILGNSCRQLLNTFILQFKKNNPNKKINIGLSPIHHSSFIKLIEYHFQTDEIMIFDLDKNYNRVIIPKKYQNITYDLIIVTHLFGNYLNIEEVIRCISSETLLVEDVILAGEFKYEFDNNSDIIFHSSGIDKRPTLLTGGYVHIKNKHKKLINNIISSIKSLPKLSFKDNFIKIYENTILYLLYNNRFLQNSIKIFLNIINYKLSNLIKKIRTNVKGFTHDNFMKKPNNFIVEQIIKNYHNNHKIESLFIEKNKLFYSQFNYEERKEIFPWHSYYTSSCLPYTPIYVESKYQKELFSYFDKNNTSIANNPTYRTFKNQQTIQIFLDNILYISSLHTLSEKEIIQLSIFLRESIEKVKNTSMRDSL